MDIWENVSCEYDRETGGERWLRKIDSDCWISALYRRTGFGHMEWETAIVFLHHVTGREPTFQDRDCMIIGGDRRRELESMPKEQLRQWYQENIEGNRNSMETLLLCMKEAIANK